MNTQRLNEALQVILNILLIAVLSYGIYSSAGRDPFWTAAFVANLATYLLHLISSLNSRRDDS